MWFWPITILLNYSPGWLQSCLILSILSCSGCGARPAGDPDQLPAQVARCAAAGDWGAAAVVATSAERASTSLPGQGHTVIRRRETQATAHHPLPEEDPHRKWVGLESLVGWWVWWGKFSNSWSFVWLFGKFVHELACWFQFFLPCVWHGSGHFVKFLMWRGQKYVNGEH